MEGNKTETSAAERSEEIIYTSVKFSQPPPIHANDGLKHKGPCSQSSLVCRLTVGVLSVLLLVQGVMLVVLHMSDSCPRCPELWVGYGDSCYFFSKERKDWNSSQESCAAESAHLLVISDTQEMNLFKRIPREQSWIGLRNTTRSGWVWADSSGLSEIKVISNSPVQHCGVLMNGVFQASSCSVSMQWICEKSLK
ncbi:killer cell lectin-like receptor subfamily G member 1 [Alligator mississippiensis]|uniref:Killer cell lectin-like receptor subfamily G member 1 n=1 Tax=Alligator mississippiensis TaxID=8496 RepID=A0A151P6D0_ALLMI|nr:killer cell lectin-like receptor subfamily G member 1 [Alligator mississippiensis]